MLNIGGYFELEIPGGREFHDAKYRFGFARHALSAILINRNIRVLHVPDYLCMSILEATERAGCKAKFYGQKDLYTPNLPERVAHDEAVLLINYFGLVDIEALIKQMSGRVIVDYSQCFFAPPPAGVDTFYSARKFFGLPDGSYLYTDLDMDQWFAALPAIRAYDLMQHLIERVDGHQQDGFMAFQKIKQKYRELPISRMSKASHHILGGLNYDQCKESRLSNFRVLDSGLKQYNELQTLPSTVPMYYPLLINDGNSLRDQLVRRGIFIPKYRPKIEYTDDAFNNRVEFAFGNCLPTHALSYLKTQIRIVLDFN